MATVVKYNNVVGFKAFTTGSSAQFVDISGSLFVADELVLTGALSTSAGAEFGGPVTSTLGFSGSLTRLVDGSSYLVAGDNVTITSASNGSVTISAVAISGSGGADVDWIDNGGNLSTTSSLNVENSASFAGPVTSTLGFSGSLTRLANGLSYLVEGENVTITSASNGSVTIAAITGSGGVDVDWQDNGDNLSTTSSLNVENNASFAGTITSTLGFSGSLTRLVDGSSYLVAGENVTITSQSNGSITIAAVAGTGGGGADVDWTDNGGNLSTTSSLNVENSAAFDGPVTSTLGFSGSLTKLTDDSSYLVEGDNVSITSASNGSVTIATERTFISIGGNDSTGGTNEKFIHLLQPASRTTPPGEGNSGYNFPCSASGSVIRVSLYAYDDPGDVVCRVYKNFETTPFAYVTGTTTSNGGGQFIGSFMITGSFDPGDILNVTEEPSADPTTLSIQFVLGYDIDSLLSTS